LRTEVPELCPHASPPFPREKTLGERRLLRHHQFPQRVAFGNQPRVEHQPAEVAAELASTNERFRMLLLHERHQLRLQRGALHLC